MRSCGNATNIVKHLRFNHNEEYDEGMQQQSEGEKKKGAKVRSPLGHSGVESDSRLSSYFSLCNDVKATRVPCILLGMHVFLTLAHINTDLFHLYQPNVKP